MGSDETRDGDDIVLPDAAKRGLDSTKVTNELLERMAAPTKALTEWAERMAAPTKALTEWAERMAAPTKAMTETIKRVLGQGSLIADSLAIAGTSATLRQLAERTAMNIALPSFEMPRVKLGAEAALPAPPAKSMYERLRIRIAKFEENLDPDHEVGAIVVAFMGEPIYIDGLGYHGPDMVIFYGATVRNEPVELLQHYSQTSLMLVSLKKRHAHAVRIGFDLTSCAEQAAPADQPQAAQTEPK